MARKKSSGFTILEVLVSVTIIAVLTAVGIVSYSSVNKRSRDVKRKSDLEQIRSAFEMYRSDNAGAYRGTGDNWWRTASNPITASLVPTYMPAIPNDPDSTQNYWYRSINTGGSPSSYCLCAKLETITSEESTCTVALYSACNYGLKNP